jgi:hypothetical protein
VTAVLGAVIGLSAFGALAEATGSFAVAARLLGGFAALSALGFGALPETRGTELEDLEADPPQPWPET